MIGSVMYCSVKLNVERISGRKLKKTRQEKRREDKRRLTLE
jgi:hypothetical protein